MEESGPPAAINLSGNSFIRVLTPAPKWPSPTTHKPKSGIIKPPISNPMALIVSETATAFNPPKMA